ncbi:MAG: helix-turn-helix domain-containing protein [Prolixibacteraceae bacterium]|nr:helix-turn-helix domain-containing protein [Prolixibacteraceae bacterium]
MQTLTFEQLPGAVTELNKKLERMETVLLQLVSTKPEVIERKSAPEAAKYLNIALPTLYGLVSQRKIRNSKAGKKLSFLTTDLDEYLNSGQRQTAHEMAANAMRKGGRSK